MAVDWQNLLKQVAPWIGAAATGNVPAMITMAAAQVGNAFGIDIKPTADAIGAAITGATPDQMLALKQADNDFVVKMQQLGFDHISQLEQIAANDRDSARKREITLGDNMPAILSCLVVLFTALCEGALLSGFEPRVAPEIVGRILGTLDSATMLVLTYYFGTTANSHRKTELLAQQAG
jgi:hypothetical protein